MKAKSEVFNMDCIEGMKQYPDNYFELAIVDPPYGIGDFRSSKSQKHHKEIDWNNAIPNKEYFDELYRVSKNRIIFGSNYYREFIKDYGAIVHDKTGGGKRNAPKGLSDCDIASHSFGNNMKIFHYVSIGNVIGNTIDFEGLQRWHPCQKPIALYKWILTNYAKNGDKILDTHLGSGTSRIAAYDLGFEFTGFELNEDYFKASEKRFKQHTDQLTLF